MAFDPYAFAEEHGLADPERAARATRATQHGESAPRVAQVARVARCGAAGAKPEPNLRAPASSPQPTPAPPPGRPAEVSPHGATVDGRPLTWTGKVVSLAEWRRLSEWERHGSTGKVWNGLTRRWEPGGGAA